MTMFLLILGVPIVVSVIAGIGVFTLIKHLRPDPPLWLRIVSGLVSAGIATLGVFVDCYLTYYPYKMGHLIGDGYIMMNYWLLMFGLPPAIIIALVFGAGVAQKPK